MALIDMSSLRKTRDEALGIPEERAAQPVTYADRLIRDLPGRYALAEQKIKQGVDIEGGLRELDSIDDWLGKNQGGVDAILSATPKTEKDAMTQKAAALWKSRAGIDALRAVGQVSLSATRTPADLITTRIPGMLQEFDAKAAEGDTVGAKAVLDATYKTVKESEAQLRTFTQYTGENPIAAGIRDSSAKLLSMDWYNSRLGMTDKRTNKNFIAREAAQNGWGPALKGLSEMAMYDDDPSNRSMAQAALTAMPGVQADKESRAFRNPRGATPAGEDGAGLSDAPAVSFDQEKYSNYVQRSLGEQLKPNGIAMSPAQFGSIMRDLSDVDIETDGSGVRFATSTVTGFRTANKGAADPVRESELFTVTSRAYANGLRAYAGSSEDVTALRNGRDTFEHLTKGIKPEEWTTQKAETVVSAMRRAGTVVQKLSTLDDRISKSAGRYLAGALYKFDTNGKMDDDEARAYRTYSTTEGLRQKIVARMPTETKENADMFVGFNQMNTRANNVIDAIQAEALAAGRDMPSENEVRSELRRDGGVAERTFMKGLKDFAPGASDKVLGLVSKASMSVWAETGEFNASTLPLIVEAAAAAKYEKDIAIAGGATGATTPEVNRAHAELKDGVSDYVKTAPQGSADADFLTKLLGANIGPASRDLAPGEADVNLVKSALRETWSDAKLNMLFTENKVARSYLDNLKVKDLGDAGSVVKGLADIIEAGVKKDSPLLAGVALSDEGKKKVREAIVGYAQAVVGMVEGKAAGGSGDTQLGFLLGSDNIFPSVVPTVYDKALAALPALSAPALVLGAPGIAGLVSTGAFAGTGLAAGEGGKGLGIRDVLIDAAIGGERGWDVKSRFMNAALAPKAQDKKANAISEEAKATVLATMQDLTKEDVAELKNTASWVRTKVTEKFNDRKALDFYNGLPERLTSMGLRNVGTISAIQNQLEQDLFSKVDTKVAMARAGVAARSALDAELKHVADLKRQAKVDDKLALEDGEM